MWEAVSQSLCGPLQAVEGSTAIDLGAPEYNDIMAYYWDAADPATLAIMRSLQVRPSRLKINHYWCFAVPL